MGSRFIHLLLPYLCCARQKCSSIHIIGVRGIFPNDCQNIWGQLSCILAPGLVTQFKLEEWGRLHSLRIYENMGRLHIILLLP